MPRLSAACGEGELIDPKAWKLDKKYRCPACKADLPTVLETDLHMHDLRRTQGSWQAAMGISLAIIGKSLGHADLKSTQVYSRLQLDPVKDAVGRASGAMVEAAGVQIKGSGVELVVTERKEGAGMARRKRQPTSQPQNEHGMYPTVRIAPMTWEETEKVQAQFDGLKDLDAELFAILRYASQVEEPLPRTKGASTTPGF